MTTPTPDTSSPSLSPLNGREKMSARKKACWQKRRATEAARSVPNGAAPESTLEGVAVADVRRILDLAIYLVRSDRSLDAAVAVSNAAWQRKHSELTFALWRELDAEGALFAADGHVLEQCTTRKGKRQRLKLLRRLRNRLAPKPKTAVQPACPTCTARKAAAEAPPAPPDKDAPPEVLAELRQLSTDLMVLARVEAEIPRMTAFYDVCRIAFHAAIGEQPVRCPLYDDLLEHLDYGAKERSFQECQRHAVAVVRKQRFDRITALTGISV